MAECYLKPYRNFSYNHLRRVLSAHSVKCKCRIYPGTQLHENKCELYSWISYGIIVMPFKHDSLMRHQSSKWRIRQQIASDKNPGDITKILLILNNDQDHVHSCILLLLGEFFYFEIFTYFHLVLWCIMWRSV